MRRFMALSLAVMLLLSGCSSNSPSSSGETSSQTSSDALAELNQQIEDAKPMAEELELYVDALVPSEYKDDSMYSVSASLSSKQEETAFLVTVQMVIPNDDIEIVKEISQELYIACANPPHTVESFQFDFVYNYHLIASVTKGPEEELYTLTTYGDESETSTFS